MKILLRVFALVLFVSVVQLAHSQACHNSGPSICTAGNNLTMEGFSPPADSAPCVIQGVPYSLTIQVKVPTSAVVAPYGTVTINWIKIDTISNLPCGLCWATNSARDSFRGGEQFCIKVTGTSYDNVGQFKLRIIINANATAYGIITQTENNLDASTVGLSYWARVQSPIGTCVALDTSATYVGNTASDTTPGPSNAVTASGALSFCQGGAVTFTATQTSALYQWYNGATAITNATSRTYTATTAGSYTVQIIKNCHLVISNAQTVVVNSPPTASVTPAGPVILCGGSTAPLTAAISGGTLQWYNASGAIASATSTSYTATVSGNYYVVATQSGCTDTSNKVNVQISGTPPTPTISATRMSLCSGATDTLDAGTGYTSYAWSNSLGSTQKVYPTAAGTYSVTVANGVCSGSASIVISAAPATPTPTITPSGTVTICQGSSAVLQSSVASSYLWNTGATTSSITVSTANSYTITTNNGCGPATSAPVTIVVTPKPNGQVNPSGTVVVCGGGTQLLTATGGGTYQWQKDSVAIGGQISSTYTAATSGNYSVVVTTSGCADTSNIVNVQITNTTLTPVITAARPFVCPTGNDTLDVGNGYTSYAWSANAGSATVHSVGVSASGTYTVTVHNGSCSGVASINLSSQVATPMPTITATGATTFCQGGSVILVSSPSSSYLWNNGGSTTDSITVTTGGGNYTVTTNNGCGAATSSPFSVTVNPIPVAAITPAGSTLICGGSSQTLTATPAGGSYVWIESGSTLSGQTANTTSASTTGTYQAIVTVNGCSDSSNVATITVSGTPPTPVITATSTLICPSSGPDTLDVGTGYSSYVWSGSGNTTSSITITAGGTYSVTVANGVCVGSASIVINQGTATPSPTISVTAGALNICGNDSVTLTSSAVSNNVWSNGATDQSITEYNAGIFTVINNGACGAATSAPDTVVKNPIPSVYAGADTGACTGTSLFLNATGNATSYAWSNGVNTALDSVATGATYTVVAALNGCTASSSVNVTFDAPPTATYTNNNGILAAAAGGSTYQWLKNGTPIAGATSSTYDINTNGTVGSQANYSVEVSNGYCFATSASQLITILGLNDISQSITTHIYPNPTNAEVTISYTLSRDEDLEITLTDMTGRTVGQIYNGMQPSGKYDIVTSLATYTSGVYMVTFKTPEGTMVKKVVKE
jgi:hypothetical protein